MQNVNFKDMCAIKTERMNPHQHPDRPLASDQEVRSTCRVGAPSGRCPEWTHQPSDKRGRVVPRSKQPRRCQAAEETRAPGGRAYQGGIFVPPRRMRLTF
jgi:hypothetical protein